MIEEKEPIYFSKFREHIDDKFKQLDTKVDQLDRKIKLNFTLLDKKIEKEVESLAISTANQFSEVNAKLDTIANDLVIVDDRLYRIGGDVEGLNESVNKIEGHIGRYEIRAQNIEQILNKDLSPRVLALEKLA